MSRPLSLGRRPTQPVSGGRDLAFPVRLTARVSLTRILVTVATRPPFRILYAPAVLDHLRAVPRRHYSLLRGELERQLGFEPATPTRNRKPVRGPNALGAEWELRCGPGNSLRVFYEVDHGARRVSVLAIGVKQRERLLVGNEEVEL